MSIFNNFRIATKINILVILILLLFTIGLGIVVQILVSDGVKDSAVEKAQSDMHLSYQAVNQEFPGEWTIRDGQLYKGDFLVNGNFEIVDYIAGMTGGTVTIFQGDTRVSTNVEIDGERVVGTQASDEVIQAVLNGGQDYFGEANVAGTMMQTAYQPIHNENGETIGMWYVGVSQAFIDDTIGAIFKGFLIVSAIGIALAVVIVFLFANQIKRRLNAVGVALEKAGNGDFTMDPNDDSKDEIGQLTQSYNLMKNNLSTLIKQVIDTSEQVAASSEELSAGAEETSRATDQISESIQSIASGSEKQVSTTTKANQSASGISRSMEQISASVESANHSSEITREKSNSGHEVIQQTVAQMSLIDDKTGEISTVVEQLGNKSNEIGKIISLITEVAEQTNLLALNAAIEAARAGEHGKGFAVVADEVRKLAEQSSGSANQIRNLIQDIQNDINRSVVSMNETKIAVKDGITSVGQAGNEFEDISVSVNEVTTQIQGVSRAVQQITGDMGAMINFINEASSIAGESAGYSEEVAASAEEQNATMEEVASAAMTLAKMAEDLQESVKKFKL
ncbi:methyl-accepting chemotaxis protein [Halalkalibacter nanhaiisediminis]|uniref:Methyl-accepting chemotaxis protein n=1 Tax=Halalkalibacter nanhaiisediminis TaxID=688079 RepID=A0A562QGS8_9BACI|nr:methyl-accepting chemotaxis protein [Halalkalibacter nanhaiisediminis]TWI55873.1 methyl-accepting chemotaxis protein [Halalkalibacter nanhaiisediminis]